jgi:hypothetical protein
MKDSGGVQSGNGKLGVDFLEFSKVERLKTKDQRIQEFKQEF